MAQDTQIPSQSYDIPTPASFRRRTIRFLRRQPVMAVCSVFIVVVALLAALAPILPLHPETGIDIDAINEAPSFDHPMGTDYRGRDQFAGIIFGGRVSLMVGFFGVLLGVGLGTVWGLLSGFLGGAFDTVSQRVVEVILSIPGLLLAFVLAAAMGPGVFTIILAISIRNIGSSARVIRGVTLSTKGADYVMAARSVGAPWYRVVARHVAPSCIAPFLVLFSAQIGLGIVIEASLSFLGVGVPPSVPSWGALVSAPLETDTTPSWWLVVGPGAMISLVVLCFNIIGDGLRDELDPRLRGVR